MGRHRAVEADRFRLLFVCTGNICRSPFAEILTRHLLLARLGGRVAPLFEVGSAGVQAVVGAPMHPDSRAELRPWGLHGLAADRFAARQLVPAMVESADLVLCAGPRHRTSVVECSPAGLAVAFSLREFARLVARIDPALLPDDPVERAHALVDHARHGRGMVPPGQPDDDRIPDPMGGTPAAHHEAAVLVRDAVEVVVQAVSPSPRARPNGPARAAGRTPHG